MPSARVRTMLVPVVLALLTGLTGLWTAPAGARTQLEGVPAFGHVFVIMGENTELGQVNKSNAPFLLGSLKPGKSKRWPLDEEVALTLGLLFRVLAPMKNLDRIRQVAEGVEKMSREEAGYWLGMVMHREYPRRVLASLRILLTTP